MVENISRLVSCCMPKNLSYEGNTHYNKHYLTKKYLQRKRALKMEGANPCKEDSEVVYGEDGCSVQVIVPGNNSGRPPKVPLKLDLSLCDHTTTTDVDIDNTVELALSSTSEETNFSEDYTRMTEVASDSDYDGLSNLSTPPHSIDVNLGSGDDFDLDRLSLSTIENDLEDKENILYEDDIDDGDSGKFFIDNNIEINKPDCDIQGYQKSTSANDNVVIKMPDGKNGNNNETKDLASADAIIASMGSLALQVTSSLENNETPLANAFENLETDTGGGFFEDREFDFLRTEKIRRSTSLKSNKTPPGTPRRKKAVRFADALGLDLESVRHILSMDTPPKIPASATKDLNTDFNKAGNSLGTKFLSPCFSQPGAAPDFRERVQEGKVVLENCLITGNLTITGTVRVANVSYHKRVMVRYSTNGWVTFEDISASYVYNSNDGKTDRFSFTIHVPSYFETGQRLEFSLMYSSGGQSFWDNNYGGNYIVECFARAVPESDTTWLHFL